MIRTETGKLRLYRYGKTDEKNREVPVKMIDLPVEVPDGTEELLKTGWKISNYFPDKKEDEK